MNLTLRIVGIQEQEDLSREAEIDSRLYEMNVPPTRESIRVLLDEIPERYKAVLDLVIKNKDGRRIGSLTLPIEDWPGVAAVGNEWVLSG